MKRLEEKIKKYLPDESIKTDKDLKDYLAGIGIKMITAIEDSAYFHYGYFNKNTKTSLYLISEYGPNPDVFYREQEMEELKNWLDSGCPDSPTDNKAWKKACKKKN